MVLRNDISQALSLSIWHANFWVLTTFGHWNCLCFRFRVHKTEGLSNCNQSKDKLFFWRKGDVALSTLFINLLTVLLFQHLFQTQYLMFYSAYQRDPPLSAAASPYSSFFSVYLAFIEISCVWINIVHIKPNLCLYNKFSSKCNRFINIHVSIHAFTAETDAVKIVSTGCRWLHLKTQWRHVNWKKGYVDNFLVKSKTF